MKKNNNTEKAALDAIKISEALKKGTEKNLQSLINEAISNAINESEDDEDSEDGESLASEKDTDANFEDTDVTPDNDEMGGEMDDEESEDADDEWSDFDDLKVGDNEYDATEVDDETALKIYNKLDDSDELVVTKNDDGEYEFETNDGNEYVIELPDEGLFSTEGDGDNDLDNNIGDEDEDADVELEFDDEEESDDEDKDADIELEFDDEEESDDKDEDADVEFEFDDEDESDDEDEDTDIEVELDDEDDDNLNEDANFVVNGYQKNPLPGLKMNEPSNPNATYSMDGGAPKGTNRPYGKMGDGKPFGETNETRSTATKRRTPKKILPFTDTTGTHRNVSKQGEFKSLEINETMRELRAIQNENKQYKKALGAIKSSLKEAAVLNVTLGQVVKILCENSTSKSEKQSIVERFNRVKTIRECKELYKEISRELNENKRSVVNIDKGYTTNSSKSLNETTIYNKTSENPSIALMERMDNLWK